MPDVTAQQYAQLARNLYPERYDKMANDMEVVRDMKYRLPALIDREDPTNASRYGLILALREMQKDPDPTVGNLALSRNARQRVPGYLETFLKSGVDSALLGLPELIRTNTSGTSWYSPEEHQDFGSNMARMAGTIAGGVLGFGKIGWALKAAKGAAGALGGARLAKAALGAGKAAAASKALNRAIAIPKVAEPVIQGSLIGASQEASRQHAEDLTAYDPEQRSKVAGLAGQGLAALGGAAFEALPIARAGAQAVKMKPTKLLEWASAIGGPAAGVGMTGLSMDVGDKQKDQATPWGKHSTNPLEMGLMTLLGGVPIAALGARSVRKGVTAIPSASVDTAIQLDRTAAGGAVAEAATPVGTAPGVAASPSIAAAADAAAQNGHNPRVAAVAAAYMADKGLVNKVRAGSADIIKMQRQNQAAQDFSKEAKYLHGGWKESVAHVEADNELFTIQDFGDPGRSQELRGTGAEPGSDFVAHIPVEAIQGDMAVTTRITGKPFSFWMDPSEIKGMRRREMTVINREPPEIVVGYHHVPDENGTDISLSLAMVGPGSDRIQYLDAAAISALDPADPRTTTLRSLYANYRKEIETKNAPKVQGPGKRSVRIESREDIEYKYKTRTQQLIDEILLALGASPRDGQVSISPRTNQVEPPTPFAAEIEQRTGMSFDEAMALSEQDPMLKRAMDNLEAKFKDEVKRQNQQKGQ